MLRRDPYLEVQDVFDQMRRLFDDFDSSPGRGAYPPIDIRETGDHVTLVAEVAGVPRDALEIQIDGRHLTIRGERQPAVCAEGDVVCHRERRYGPFERTFELGFEVDREQVSADYHHGVLTITLPKAAAAKSRKIEVRTA